MNPHARNILVTGPPGIGKTTLMLGLYQQLRHRHPAGFITQEIREKGVRQGFSLESFDGRTGILSHVDLRTPHRVGKYRVDVSGFEAFLQPLTAASADITLIDEIGKMECFSPLFLQWIERLLDGKHTVIATIALKGGGPIARIKARNDIALFLMTPSNRGHLVKDILSHLVP